jgi:LmbE family N-acetylglucosaminyl deacetylase
MFLHLKGAFLFYERQHSNLSITYIRKSTHCMKYFSAFCLLLFAFCFSVAQTPKTYTSSEILMQLKKLNVLGSVLYIAAHPDDENTRLLAYLANEKMYRTGYLSLTRGDGGQNLIGDEQGIDLGLIRTQELLAARRIDGAEQFFSRAYDFGFCKSSEEALATWGHDKILSDVVWVVRKFKPDVIIARFPEDSRAGHGHHAASGILAREAFDAAADPTKFPEQLTQGVSIWQAKRMLWNTFNFGGNSTQNESQFKTDVGMYNPLLGKSYGEIAALSRSQHKSQGFGVPAQRGAMLEYFETIKGEKPVNDLFDGVDAGWQRVPVTDTDKDIRLVIKNLVQNICDSFNHLHTERSLQRLVQLYNVINSLDDSYWKNQKLKELQNVIENCSGLFMEATANTQYAVQGDSLKINLFVNNRLGINVSSVIVNIFDTYNVFNSLPKNTNANLTDTVFITEKEKLTQPYWLENYMDKGSFNVSNQQLIGKAENDPLNVQFKANIEGTDFTFIKPIRYKFTDPVRGEIYQPVNTIPQLTAKVTPALVLNEKGKAVLTVNANKDLDKVSIFRFPSNFHRGIFELGSLKKSEKKSFNQQIRHDKTFEYERDSLGRLVSPPYYLGHDSFSLRRVNSNESEVKPEILKEQIDIVYDHIPTQTYFKTATLTFKPLDVKHNGHSIGYIPGAGDKVPQALEQMGYKVTTLKEADITSDNLKQFNAVITGIRAYNTNDWMGNVYETLMKYVEEGGVLLTQYNTSNFISNVKSKIGPYPFSISRTRVTDETAKVNFLLPDHPALNYPNKITANDFEGWVQERSVYHADKIDSNYQRIISMNDAGENADDGSLIIANYGKGKFVYTGLVFFRELPAGVPGAYRLFANLIAPLNLPRGGTLKVPAVKSSKQNGKKGRK